MGNQTILVVEDDIEIGNAIEIYLKNQNYEVLRAYNGKEGLDVISKNKIHLAIVDMMMPEMDGLTMIMKLRESNDFPVLILSAKSEDLDKITGLNMGADDYITKPFKPMELLARVNSQLRRYNRFLEKINEQDDSNTTYVVGGLEVNEDTKEVKIDGEIVKCTPIEFKILLLLIKNPGRVYSLESIYELVWNEEAIATDTVMVHIRNIREKIEIDSKNPRYLKVVWGVGYKIEKE
ncbi:response regulator transcription factor [Anaerorhabdus furcosa]|uniref:DNA-binding response regulator, OmpR family, contains REC and winged-helix (WHTH) domain n=1 Tax=Anaerorhabdus furcosa TaxID=118967 RepID=A0A1T4MSB0_9FIRM|nr:response regulator transcription factor [Anaerorhabdus furcosa]SJZ69694.1 DNA-binding response regulator, OmpR family, contains REC and winged-helix (wHTH) domain [Anaerorhabdus furcosa]